MVKLPPNFGNRESNLPSQINISFVKWMRRRRRRHIIVVFSVGMIVKRMACCRRTPPQNVTVMRDKAVRPSVSLSLCTSSSVVVIGKEGRKQESPLQDIRYELVRPLGPVKKFDRVREFHTLYS